MVSQDYEYTSKWLGNTTLDQPQYHYDIGYGGLFAHYRSSVVPNFKEAAVVEHLRDLKQMMDTTKTGIQLGDVADLEAMSKIFLALNDMGFYMVNFETKNMVDNELFLRPNVDDFAPKSLILC